jgi:uncharacterized membrane protein
MLIETLRWLHVIGATVLIGTGAGIAFFMLMAWRSRAPALIAHVGDTVVLADFLFTATAVVAQPATGLALAMLVGWRLAEPWLAISLGLYLLIGACWLPVVWIQVRLRDLARVAVAAGEPMPPRAHRLFAIWFALGVPAFVLILAIAWLMTNKPAIG